MAAPVFDGTVGDRLVNMIGRNPSRRKLKGGDLGTDDVNEQREFIKILKEVEALGTSQLGWKERKDLEQKKLESLGAKAKKSFKMPISMGSNIKRKREKLDSDKLVEDALSGLRPNKSGRKAPRRERETGEDKGLQASEGKFKGGVLYVKPLVKAPVESKRRGGDRSLDRVFGEGSGKKGGGKKGKRKGKGGKKSGGKRRR